MLARLEVDWTIRS